MIVVGLVLAGIAALIHVYIWVMESFGWTGARARATFGTTPEEAAATRELAFNQGFYNLFLAIGALVGIILYGVGQHTIGLTLVFFTLTCMVLAAVVLVSTGARYIRAALIQGILPLAGIVLIFLSDPITA